MNITQRCPIAGCFVRVSLSAFDKHMLNHYNYCEYGHYEEFDLDDPTWPKCKNEWSKNDE
jgi:hypothetical protein